MIWLYSNILISKPFVSVLSINVSVVWNLLLYVNGAEGLSGITLAKYLHVSGLIDVINTKTAVRNLVGV